MIVLINKLKERDELISNLEEKLNIQIITMIILNNISKRIYQLKSLLIKNNILLPENINKGNLNKNANNNKNIYLMKQKLMSNNLINNL